MEQDLAEEERMIYQPLCVFTVFDASSEPIEVLLFGSRSVAILGLGLTAAQWQ